MDIDLARLEAIARQMCRNAGHDPDAEWVLAPRAWQPVYIGDLQAYSVGIASRGPAWHGFTGIARDVLQATAQVDAA
jgi:hypothetical protein